MKASKKVWGMVAVALSIAGGAVAQTPDAVLREFEKLKEQVAAQSRTIEGQSRRIEELERGKSDEARASTIETEINRVSARAAAATTVRSAADRLTFSGEYRFRGYLEFGDDATGTERDGYFNSSKIRLGILYEFSKNVAAYIDIQSTFAFGHNGHSSSNLANADPGEPLHVCQAWVEMGDVFDREELRMRLGRQSITLGNQFQFGNADWYNGYFFDGLRGDWNAESWSLTGLFVRTATVGGNDGNQFVAYGPANIGAGTRDGHDHDEYYSLYFTLKSIKDHTLDLYWIYANWHEGVTLNSVGGTPASVSGAAGGFSPAYFHTFGARIAGNLAVADGLDWNLEAAYQTGDLDAAPVDLDVGAFAVEGEVGLMFDKESKVRAWMRGLFAEGPEAGETGYLPLAPNRHSQTAAFRARYGQMDVFPMTNVFALTGGVHFDPAAEWTVGLTGTWGQADSGVGAALDDSYGFEVDLWAEYRYSDQLTLSGGASVLFPDDQLDGTAGATSLTFDGDAQLLLWLQARLFF